MTKADIVSEISKSTGIDKTDSVEQRRIFMDIVKSSLSQGENVYLRGFGSFVIKREPRRLLVIFQKILRSSSRNITFRHSSRLRLS